MWGVVSKRTKSWLEENKSRGGIIGAGNRRTRVGGVEEEEEEKDDDRDIFFFLRGVENKLDMLCQRRQHAVERFVERYGTMTREEF